MAGYMYVGCIMIHTWTGAAHEPRHLLRMLAHELAAPLARLCKDRLVSSGKKIDNVLQRLIRQVDKEVGRLKHA